MSLQSCLFEVLLYLDVEDCVRIGLVSKSWWRGVRNPSIWRAQCKMVWGLSDSEIISGEEAEQFRNIAEQFWKYRSVYGDIKLFWDKIKTWMTHSSPRMLMTLNNPATEGELDAVETKLGIKLTLPFRCFYKFHNGQDFDHPGKGDTQPFANLDGTQVDEYVSDTGKNSHDHCVGMFGGWSLYDMHVSMGLLSLDMVAIGFFSLINVRNSAHKTLPFAADLTRGTPQLLRQVCSGPNEGQIEWSGADSVGHKASNSFMEYLQQYMSRIENGVYRSRLGEIMLFPCGNSLGATTTESHGMRIEASPLLVPFQSDNNVKCFTYRLTITSISATCQLHTRSWYTRDMNMNDTHAVIRSNAIIGYYPSFKPGDSWEYASATRSTDDWSQFGGSLSFFPGTLMNPTGSEFNCDIDPMTLSMTHTDN